MTNRQITSALVLVACLVLLAYIVGCVVTKAQIIGAHAVPVSGVCRDMWVGA